MSKTVTIVLWIFYGVGRCFEVERLNRNPKTSLVIIPERYGNLARYLSGINNSSKESCKRQVVVSVLCYS